MVGDCCDYLLVPALAAVVTMVISIDDFHNMRALLAACRELVTDYDMFPEMLCVFAHITYLLIQAQHTRIVLFWQISDIFLKIS